MRSNRLKRKLCVYEFAFPFAFSLLFDLYLGLQENSQSHLYGVAIAKGDARKGHSSRYSAKSLPYKKLVLNLVHFITEDKRPLSIANSLGFRKFCYAMNSAFTVPNHAFLSRVCHAVL